MNEGEKTIQVWAEHSHRKKKSGTYEAFMTINQIMHLFSMSILLYYIVHVWHNVRLGAHLLYIIVDYCDDNIKM